MSRLVVVSNRIALPDDKKSSAGGLAVGILGALRAAGGLWFGWSGEIGDDQQPLKQVSRGNISWASFNLNELAVQALKNKDFVLEADRIEFKRGSFVYVTPNTNFVSVKGEKATIQLAFNTPAAGPNGIGGITVDGTTSGVQMKTDKKGNVMYEMNVQGVAVSAI